jgi:branched-chain amino acid transport system substrate-binding protein
LPSWEIDQVIRKIFAVLACLTAGAAVAQTPIRIGEINSYKALPAFLEPYKMGMDLAIEQINADGGVIGRPLELIVRDDSATPGDAVRVAQALVTRDRVDVLAGTFLSHIGLAVSDFARQRKVFFLASEPLTDKLVWENGNEYTFRLRPSTYMQVAMLVPEAVAMNKKRWAIVYPNYEYGQSGVETFKRLMRQAQPDIEFVAEQATPLGKIDAGSVTQALVEAKPEAIFNMLFAADLARFVREGNTRGLFEGVEVVSLLTGEPEYLDPLKDETPEGWLVTGYPWYGIDTPEHEAFLAAYQKRFNDYPRLGSVVGYATIVSLAAGIEKAGSVETDKLIAAFKGLTLMTPFGQITYRAEDHQSTMGSFVGRTKQIDGQGVMDGFRYVDGAAVLPEGSEAAQWRPKP